MAKKSMFFTIQTTNGRGEHCLYIIPARDGFSATQEVAHPHLKVDVIEFLRWHDVNIASQQYGEEIIFESNIRGQHHLFFPQTPGYRHLLAQFSTEVVRERAFREEEKRRIMEEIEYQNNHPFG